MYTFCPDCTTVFSIRAEHLHAASGLVRCGECRQVFTAVDHLYDGLVEARFALFKLTEVEQVATSDEEAIAGNPPVDDSSAVTNISALNPEPAIASSAHGGSWSRQPVSMKDVSSGAGIGLLLLLLAGQWVYFNRADLAMKPSWRPVVERVCAILDCELPLPSDIGQVALLDRDVRRHPEVRDALLVNATLVNRAAFTQSYPVLSIRFSDLAGKPIAERRFRPVEYLGVDLNHDAGMVPDVPVHVVLEIEDPGEEAVSFQFDFL
jgi:predicted Zn finger-like uncharacterized protein